MDDTELHEFVASNPGQGTFEEYRLIRDVLRRRAPGNVLIFGVGKDTGLWLDANKGGQTVFVEHEPEWIQKTRELNPGVRVVPVTYRTSRRDWRKLLDRQDILFMEDLPNDVLATAWDVILVDSPQGGHDKRPGRMKSIYTASVLARRAVDVEVLVHDCDREVEQVYCDTYLGPTQLVGLERTLRHYRVRPNTATLRHG